MNAYKTFAYYYDEVYQDLDYKLWLDFIEPYLSASSSILDVACGTGTLAILLKLKGYDVEGLDLSDSIIEIAKEKSKINHLSIPFYVADMTNFKLEKTYDMVTCFFDSFNFLKNIQLVNSTLVNIYTHLKPGGYLIFDLFSKPMLKEYKRHKKTIKNKTHKITWKTKLTSSTTLKHHILIQEGDIQQEETYEEFYYDFQHINFEGYQIIKICGDFNGELNQKDERILIVLKKTSV